MLRSAQRRLLPGADHLSRARWTHGGTQSEIRPTHYGQPGWDGGTSSWTLWETLWPADHTRPLSQRTVPSVLVSRGRYHGTANSVTSNNRNIFSAGSGVWNSEIMQWQGHTPSEGGGEKTSCLFELLVLPWQFRGFLGLQPHGSNLCLWSHVPSSCDSAFTRLFSSKDSGLFGCRGAPSTPAWPHFNSGDISNSPASR